jgi:hypothetical protein
MPRATSRRSIMCVLLSAGAALALAHYGLSLSLRAIRLLIQVNQLPLDRYFFEREATGFV